ncbi:putative methyltransferase DDB_G0268948 isoform X2 [Amphiura filiformis]|uniref:putative methyltransferase DDB_G0268948 isoform X2 n=1 Tax=Amphiura filiformis TaxID=82378 RepID=UPI003B2168A0
MMLTSQVCRRFHCLGTFEWQCKTLLHSRCALQRCCKQPICSSLVSSRTYSSSGEFQGQEHAALYNKYRPKPDETLVSKIVMDYVRKKTGLHSGRLGIAVDVACGSGQATEVVAGHLNKVIGVDASESQITEAKRANTTGNIEYRCGFANSLPVSDNSVNLVTCFQAAHYMDLDFTKFCHEVSRVLTKNGCLAIYTMDKHDIIHADEKIAEQLSGFYNQLYHGTLKDYFVYDCMNRQDLYMHKFVIPNQFKGVKRYQLMTMNTMTVADFIGFITSLSGYQKHLREHPEQDIITGFQQRFLEILQVETSAEETIIQLTAPVYIILASKEG